MGELGLGDTRDRFAEADLGDALPAVPLGTGRKVVALAAGDEHTCGWLDDGSLKCWGMNALGLEEVGAGWGGDLGAMGDALRPVRLWGPRAP